jgi:uncharacterized protein
LSVRRITPAVWAVWAHVLVGLACAPGLLRLETSADTRAFYGDNVYHRDLKAFEATFQKNNNVLILMRLDGARIDTSPALAAAVRSATTRAWQLPYAMRVESLATYAHVEGNEGEFLLEPLLDVLCPENCLPDTAGLLDDPLIRSRLVSKDATTVGVYVAFDLPVRTKAVQTITAAVRTLAADLKTETPGLEVHFAGGITMMSAFSEAARRDAATLIPLVLVVQFVLLILILGEVKLVGLLLLTGIYGSVVAMGLAGWLGVAVNAATSIVPVLILTLAVASGLHLLVTYLRQRLQEPGDPARAVTVALDLNTRPIVLTAVMSIVGFLSMNFANAAPLRELGNFVAVGLTAATTLLLYVLPVPLRRMRRIRVLTTSRLMTSAVQWLAETRSNVPAIVVSVFAVVAVAGTARITLNDDFVQYFDKSFEFRQGADFAREHMGGPNMLDIIVTAPEADGIYEPAYMDLVVQFSRWLRGEPYVASVVSVADILEKVARTFTGDSNLTHRTRDELAQFVLTYELSLTAGQGLEDYFDKARRSTRVSALLTGGDSQTVVGLEHGIDRWFEPYRHAGYSVVVTGVSVPVAHMSILNVTSMMAGIVLSLVVSALILGWYFKSYRILALTAPAIFLPSAMGFGLWGWLVGEIGLAASVVAGMTIGIIIDDAIHIIYRYQYTRDVLQESPRAAARTTVSSVGIAIMSTSLALGGGFLLLGLSGFQIDRTLGLCTAYIVLCGLVVDLVLVPRVLVWLDERAENALATESSR